MKLATGLILAIAGLASGATNAYAGPSGGWQPIINCESGGRNVEHGGSPGGVSSASGYFQFLDSSWRAYGGAQFASRAINATFAEQTAVADRAYAASGLTPWAASRSCWAGKLHGHAATRPVPAAPTVSSGGRYVVARGDTLRSIAAAHGTTWQKIHVANRSAIGSPDLIFAGQLLKLP